MTLIIFLHFFWHDGNTLIKNANDGLLTKKTMLTNRSDVAVIVTCFWIQVLILFCSFHIQLNHSPFGYLMEHGLNVVVDAFNPKNNLSIFYIWIVHLKIITFNNVKKTNYPFFDEHFPLFLRFCCRKFKLFTCKSANKSLVFIYLQMIVSGCKTLSVHSLSPYDISFKVAKLFIACASLQCIQQLDFGFSAFV